MLRFLLRIGKIGLLRAYAACSTIYTRIYFRLNGVNLGNGAQSNGVPLLEMSLSGKFTIGKNFRMNNGKYFNRIGRQYRCSFQVAKKARLTIGNNVGMSSSAIVCQHCVEIGDNTLIGGNCVIYDTDFHDLDVRKRIQDPEDFSGVRKKPVIIKNNVFIGAHSTILKGVTIGEASIIGAASVVTKDVPAGEIWAGNPAKFISFIP